MRSAAKWLVFILFWVSFAGSSLWATLLAIRGHYDAGFLLCVAAAVSCLVASVVSLAGSWVITSPRLGRRVIHDSGHYFIDMSIEKYSPKIACKCSSIFSMPIFLFL